MSQELKFENLVEFKFDFSCIQSGLTQALLGLNNKINKLETQNKIIQDKMETQFTKINHQILVSNEKVGYLDRTLEDKFLQLQNILSSHSGTFNNANNQDSSKKNEEAYQKNGKIQQKTPTQVLDMIEQRLSLEKPPVKQIDINSGSSNTDRVYYKVKVRDENCSSVNDSESLSTKQIDQKCYNIYVKVMEELEKQIDRTRTDLKNQLTKLDSISKKIDNIEATTQRNITHQCLQTEKNTPSVGDMNRAVNNNLKSKQTSMRNLQENRGSQRFSFENQNSNKNLLSQKNCSNQLVQSSQQKSQIDIELQKILDGELTKQKIIEFVNQTQNRLRQQLNNQGIKCQQDQLAQVTRTNSIFADHLVEIKKNIEQLTNTTDAMKIEVNGTTDKGSGVERQISLLSDSNFDLKARIKSLENSLSKLREEVKNDNIVEQSNSAIKQNLFESDSVRSPGSSRKDLMYDSRSSFRPSVLGPIRTSEITKQTHNKFEVVEENYRKMSNKLNTLIERFNRWEDDKKKFGDSQGFLPKIDKEGKSNINHYQLIKKDLKAANQQICKTNQRIVTMKDRLNQLYDSHAQIPNKIQDLYKKLREYNEFQQDRLIQLIKELVNRMLSDPFDNHFTNRLKRQINVKFLQIKHQYHSILKQIQNKVEDRAEKAQLQKVIHKFQQSVAEVKSITNKKCQVQEFKKGMKYLENRIKDVFQFTKNETTNLYNQQKQYIGVKKQTIH